MPHNASHKAYQEKKASAKKTGNGLLPRMSNLVDLTKGFNETITEGIAGLKELQASQHDGGVMASVNGSGDAVNTGGGIIQKSTNLAPSPMALIHDDPNKQGGLSSVHPDASMNRPVINVTSDTATASATEPSSVAPSDKKSSVLAVPEKTEDFEGAQGILRTPQGSQFVQAQFDTLDSTLLSQLRDTIQYELSGQGRTGPGADYQSAIISNEATAGTISQIANVRDMIANQLEGGVGLVPGINRNAALAEANIEISQFLTQAGFSEDEIRMTLNPNPGSRPMAQAPGEFDWDNAEVGTIHDGYEKQPDQSWVEVDDAQYGAQMPTEDLPQASTADSQGNIVEFHSGMQYQDKTNRLTDLINSTRAVGAGAALGIRWSKLQEAVTEPMQLPPNYIVRTDQTTGQVFVEWDFDAATRASTTNIAQPQRLSLAEERDIIAGAQAYYTQLNRAQQLLSSHYENTFKMEILDEELAQRASELELEEDRIALEGRRVQISEDEYQQLYGVDGLEGKKYEALYGAGTKAEDGTVEGMGLERLRQKVEQDRLKLEQDLRTDKLLLEAGKIIFDESKAKELGLVDAEGNAITQFTSLASDLQERTLAIQEAELKGTGEVFNSKTNTWETITTAKQRNQHTIEAQQYANAQTEQSGRQHMVMLRTDYENMGVQNRPGDLVGAYGEYLVVRTQTPSFAREQLGEAISARKNQQAIDLDRIEADKEIARISENLRLTGITTSAATDLKIAELSATSAKDVAQLRLDAEKTGIDNELTLLGKRIELEAINQGYTLDRQEIARQAELQLQIDLSKQRILEEAAQRGLELEARTAERLATLQIQKDIGTENSANALAAVEARMTAEQSMQTERLASEEGIASEAVQSAETIALAQAAAKVTLSEAERTDAFNRLVKEIEANATAQGLQLDTQEAIAEAQRTLDKELATLAGTQDISRIQAETAAMGTRVEQQLETEASFAAEQREALAIATDPIVVAQARQTASTFVANLNSSLAQGSQGNFEQAATAMAAELPPAPPGVAWDATLGRFIQRPGFEGREMSASTQEWISATTGAYKARDRAEQAIREGTRLRTESQLRESERQQADQDFRDAMLTADIDTAEEAITRQRMAETRQLDNKTKLDNLQMLFGLLANPVQLGFAKKHGLLGQIEAVLGFAIGNVPEAAVGAVVPNINEWQVMDSEQQAFSIANFVEQGGSPDAFMQMIQGTAPAQMQQVQYGVL